jgi:hypothetical protein
LNSFPKSTLIEMAVKALLLAICIPISLGSPIRVLLLSLVPENARAANERLLAELPAQQSCVPEESSPECPGSSELPEDSEAASVALPRKCQKKANFHRQLMRVVSPQPQPARDIFASSQMINLPFVHCCRNGCGTHLRC